MRLFFWRALLVLLIALVVLAVTAWLLLLRPVAQPATNDPARLFNHGSIGNEETQGLPYWIWRVMPAVFPDLLPRGRDGYGSIGMFWAQGDEVPIGFSVMTLGVIPRVAPNCAFCHQGSYRLTPQDPARLVSAGAGGRVDPQSYIRFLMRAGTDPRFTSDRLMQEIQAIYAMPLWERALYRYLLIPATRSALKDQAQRFAWMASRPDWGPGRIDPFNPVKFFNLGLPDDGTIGNSDMMPLWRLSTIDPTPLRRPALHWDGLLTDLHETVVAGRHRRRHDLQILRPHPRDLAADGGFRPAAGAAAFALFAVEAARATPTTCRHRRWRRARRSTPPSAPSATSPAARGSAR